MITKAGNALSLLLVVALISLISIGIYFRWQNQNKTDSNVPIPTPVVTQPEPEKILFKDKITYITTRVNKDEDFNYEIELVKDNSYKTIFATSIPISLKQALLSPQEKYLVIYVGWESISQVTVVNLATGDKVILDQVAPVKNTNPNQLSLRIEPLTWSPTAERLIVHIYTEPQYGFTDEGYNKALLSAKDFGKWTYDANLETWQQGAN